MELQIKKRNENLDVIKGICAYLVIIIHCGFPFWPAYIDAFCRVAVPLMFMISGYFCKGEWKEIKRKVTNLLRIFIAGEGLYFIYNLLVQGDQWRVWLQYEISPATFSGLLIYNDTSIFMAGWFLVSLMYTYLLFGVFAQFGMKKQSYILIPLLIVWQWGWQRAAMLLRMDLNFYDVKVFRAIPFFLLGNFFQYQKGVIKEKLSKNAGYVLMAVGTFLVFFERLLIEQLVFKPALFLYLGNVVLAIGCFVWAITEKEIKLLKPVAYVGKNLSLYIYVIHMWIFGMLGKTDEMTYIFQVCIISTLVSWVLYRVGLMIRNK